MAQLYRERRGDIVRQAQALTESVRASARIEASRQPLPDGLLHEAVRGLRSGFDPRWGGWGQRPKFPPASTIEFLLRRGELGPATKTLDGMALGGMYDLLGGGFHRYSVDERWLVPHFEKMLYDNSLLVTAYLHGWLVTGLERYQQSRSEWSSLVEATSRRTSSGARLDMLIGFGWQWTSERYDDDERAYGRFADGSCPVAFERDRAASLLAAPFRRR